MTSTIERAPSGRAKCRACGTAIPKDELRLGARLPNPFDETKELTLFFHLRCGACARPEPFLEAAEVAAAELGDEKEELEAEAKLGLEHPRLTRLRGAERAPTGRASCRSCREAIHKDSLRLALSFYDEVEGRFSPGGYLHPGCAQAYFGTSDVLARVRLFTPTFGAAELEELQSLLAEQRPTAPSEGETE